MSCEFGNEGKGEIRIGASKGIQKLNWVNCCILGFNLEYVVKDDELIN